MPPVIEFEQVVKDFGRSRIAVNNVSFAIEPGTAVALLGPNGAGKTTAISIMLGLLAPTSGRARLFGGHPKTAKLHERLGVMLQGVSVLDRLTVRETIELFRSYYPRPLPTERLLKASGLEKESRSFAAKMSGGQMRRLQFAMAMAGDPDVLFLDEPTVGMDVASRRAFWDELRGFVAKGKTLLLTTHDMQEADSVADRIVVMNHGHVIADEPPEKIKMRFAGNVVSFVAGSAVRVDDLRSLPGVSGLSTNGRHVTMQARDSDDLLRRLMRENWDISDIRVGGAGLEEAFVRLTEELEAK